MWPPTANSRLEWPEQLCLRKDGSGPIRGHLSDDPRVEAVLQGLLVFGPAAWLLIGAPVRIAQLRGANLVVLPNRQGYLKAVSISRGETIAAPLTHIYQLSTFALFGLQLAYLVLGILEHAHWKLLAARLLSLVAAAAVCVLSFLEHGRNVGPSTLLTSYFVIIILSDVIQAGLLYVAWNLCNPWGLASAIFATKFVLLVLEGQTKRSILREPYDKLSPEETAGFFGVAFFWWVNKVLKTGYSKVLSLDDMPPLGKSLDVMKTREAMQREWDKRSTYTSASALVSFFFGLTNQTREARRSLFSTAGAVEMSVAAKYLHICTPFHLHHPALLPTSSHQPSHHLRQRRLAGL